MNDRNLHIGSLLNCRDLGGIRNKDGKVIKSNKLYRSDALFKASKDDVLLLKEKYDLKTIIDFRGEDEVSSSTMDPIIDGVNHIYLPLNPGVRNRGTRPHDVHCLIKDLDGMIDFFFYLDEKGDVTDSMCKIYHEFITSSLAIKNLRVFLDYIVDNDGLLIYHCSDGKDRTGVTTMLILSILNVDYNTIIDDYLLTNENVKEKAKQRRKLMEENGVNDETVLNSSDIIAGVKKRWLVSTMNEIEKRYDSIDNFLTNILGFSKERQEEMRRKYLID